jgi:4-diphosphocytidyl-2C-methyl-D-erythritol kinase
LAQAVSSRGELPLELLGNAFEGVADQVFEDLPRYRAAMLGAGAGSVHLSGSGPTLFALFGAESDAGAVAGRLLERGLRPLVARTLTRSEASPEPEGR